MEDNFFFFLFQPLTQFEVTLYNTTNVFFDFSSSYFFSFEFFFDIIFFCLFFWLIDYHDQYSTVFFEIFFNTYGDPLPFVPNLFLNYLFILTELSSIIHDTILIFFYAVDAYYFHSYDGEYLTSESFFFILRGVIRNLFCFISFFFYSELYENSIYNNFSIFTFFLIPVYTIMYIAHFLVLLYTYLIFLFFVKICYLLSFVFDSFNIIMLIDSDFFREKEFFFLDTSITKFHVLSFFILINFLFFFVLCFKNPKYYFRNWNIILFGMLDEFLSNTIIQQLGIKRGQKYSVFLKSLFFLIMFGNVFGLIPFSFTITSHLIYTFALTLSLLVGITILAIYLQGVNFFNLFIPKGAPAALLLLLIPIEIISYVARCFSLAIRLFANMMSGHTLLNILSGFVIKIASNGFLLMALAPFIVVMAVTVLELGIAFLQAYVFLVLVCSYLKDGFEAGH